MGDWDTPTDRCEGCDEPRHRGVCKALDCDACGGVQTVSRWTGLCEDHEDWAECLACAASFPLIADVTVWDETDASVGLYGTAYACPACGEEDFGAAPWGLAEASFQRTSDGAA
jgi:hypothetical protein